MSFFESAKRSTVSSTPGFPIIQSNKLLNLFSVGTIEPTGKHFSVWLTPDQMYILTQRVRFNLLETHVAGTWIRFPGIILAISQRVRLNRLELPTAAFSWMTAYFYVLRAFHPNKKKKRLQPFPITSVVAHSSALKYFR